jgi:hypothetical protein
MKKTLLLIVPLLFLFLSCEDDGNDGEPVNGCTDVDATNYNSDATIDDGSCEYGSASVLGNETNISYTQGEETAHMFFTLSNNSSLTAYNVRYRLKISYKCLSNSGSQSWSNDLLALGTVPFPIEPGEVVEADAYVNRCSGLGIDEFTFEIYELIWD